MSEALTIIGTLFAVAIVLNILAAAAGVVLGGALFRVFTFFGWD